MINDETGMRFRFLRNISGLFEYSRPLRAILRPFWFAEWAVKKTMRRRSSSLGNVLATNVVAPAPDTVLVRDDTAENEKSQAMTIFQSQVGSDLDMAPQSPSLGEKPVSRARAPTFSLEFYLVCHHCCASSHAMVHNAAR